MRKLLALIAVVLSGCTAAQYSTESVVVAPKDGGETLNLDYKIDWHFHRPYVEFCPERDTCILKRKAVRVKDGKIYHETQRALFIYQ